MFSLQPPRHISTLPKTNLECPLFGRYRRESGRNADIAFRWRLTHGGPWRGNRQVCPVNHKLLSVEPSGARAWPKNASKGGSQQFCRPT